jgi:hypothetical protein
MGTLYRLKFSSGRSYIGATLRSMNRRMHSHRQALKRGDDSFLYQAWRKYGDPKLDVLAIVEDRELDSTEERAITVLNTLYPRGYNLLPTRTFNPLKIPSVVRKLSKTLTGRKLSDDHRKKTIEGLIGRPCRPETRLKISQATTGRIFSSLHLTRLRRASQKRWTKART